MRAWPPCAHAQAAEAEAEAKFLQGQGVARQRQAIITGLRDSVKDFKDDELQDVNAKDGARCTPLAPVCTPPLPMRRFAHNACL